MYLISKIFGRIIKQGCLIVVDHRGAAHVFDGAAPGPQVKVRFHDRWVPWKLAFSPGLYLGECYMDGSLTVDEGKVYEFLDLLTRNIGWTHGHPAYEVLGRLRRALRWASMRIGVGTSKRNVAHHYDLSDDLYATFLDARRQYSCAYFEQPDDNLETAQLQKLKHIAAKLCLQKGQEVLDIGSGWGGLASFLAENYDLNVKGITLSESQLAYATTHAENQGMTRQLQFALEDYRHVRGEFDRIVSVGMFEHVGLAQYGDFFANVATHLKEDGVALIHTIGRAEGPNATNAWLEKYIFPGAYIPALSEIVPAIERSGLYITDIEVLRLHYAETLRLWRQKFAGAREEVAKIYDERFCRMWEFYLSLSEVAFRNAGMVVFQIQLVRAQEAIPLTRDYITHSDRTAGARPRIVA